jgi:hypothetical protein
MPSAECHCLVRPRVKYHGSVALCDLWRVLSYLRRCGERGSLVSYGNPSQR